MIDYANPCMKAERALKDAHIAMLARDYDTAAQYTVDALVAASRMYDAIKFMKEEEQRIDKAMRDLKEEESDSAVRQ